MYKRQDGGSLGRADADGVDADALCGGALGYGDGVVLVVLTVGDEHDDTAAAGFGFARKGQQRLFQRLADGRTLHRHQRGIDAAREGFGHAVVGGDGQLHFGFSGEDHQPHAVLPQAVEEFVDGVFGAFEPVGLEILGQHGVGDVDNEHHLDALRLLLAEFRTELRPCGRQRQQRECRAEEDEFQQNAPGRHLGHQFAQGPYASEARQTPPPVARGEPEERGEERNGRQQPKKMGIGESEHGFTECV